MGEKKIGKNDLIDMVSAATEIPKATVKTVIEATTAAISKSAAGGACVGITGFGTFEMRTRAERVGRNPQTGESIMIAETRSLGFKAAKPSTD